MIYNKFLVENVSPRLQFFHQSCLCCPPSKPKGMGHSAAKTSSTRAVDNKVAALKSS